MPKCKDCIHQEACRKMLESNGFGYAYNPESSAERCDTFLNAADVVPRSEMYDDHNMQVTCYTLGCQEGDKIRPAIAREIVDEFMSAMRAKHEENRPKWGGALALLLPDIEQIATELKKKYTEGEK